MRSRPRRIRLSIGPSRAVTVLVVIAGTMMVGISLFFVLMTIFVSEFFTFVGEVPAKALPTPDPSLYPSGDPLAAPQIDTDALEGPTSAAATVVRMSGFCAVPMLGLAGYLVLHTLRYAAWLDGTTAVVRGALFTRRVDLSTVDVRGDAVRHTETHGHYRYVYLLPAILAHDRETDIKVKIPLRGQGLKRLPSAELYALAEAIMAGRPPTDPGYRTARPVAEQLWQMAADPFPTR